MQLCVIVACAYILRRNWSWGSSSSTSGATDLAAGDSKHMHAKGTPDGSGGDAKRLPAPEEEAKGAS